MKSNWYLEAPFDKCRVPLPFQTQNWWNESGDDEPAEQRPVTATAALYELLRRHPCVGEMLLAQRMPGSGLELFLFEHGRTAWPWLTAEARETFGSLAQPKKGRRCRHADWLGIISRFEGTEQGRCFDFRTLNGSRRKTPLLAKVNQIQRRAFEKACKGAYALLVS
jgi:hypothetical protein